MKLFLDTVDTTQIRKWSYFIDGLTTNPTLLARNGTNPSQHIKEILALLPGKDVSVEVTELEPEAMYAQAHKIAALGTNVVVKIPCHVNYYPIIARLVADGIRLNITLVFSLFQVLSMCKLGVTYVSPFVARLEDHDTDGSELLLELRAMIDTYGYTTQILAASMRTVLHVHEALLAGADAITIPVPVLELAVAHPLTDQGILKFSDDWKKLGVQSFP